MPGRFIAVPELPETGLQPWEPPVLGSMKENIDLLTGTRGEPDKRSRALVRGDITVNSLGTQTMRNIALISPDGFTISSTEVAGLDAFRALKEDVQSLANDLDRTRQAFDLLVKNLTTG